MPLKSDYSTNIKSSPTYEKDLVPSNLYGLNVTKKRLPQDNDVKSRLWGWFGPINPLMINCNYDETTTCTYVKSCS